MTSDLRVKKVSTNPEDNEPPEHSVPLRIVVFLMALICVAASCFFVRTHWIMTLIYVFLIVAGSYLSYVYREEEPKWLRYTWIVGIFAVGANALREFTGPLRDDFDFVSPFVHFLAGVFVFVTFSMRRRSDLNVSSGLGLMLLCMISPVAKGVDYGLCVASYLTLGSIMLYFDCVSRTMTSWVSKPMMQAPEVNLRNVSRPRRLAKGNTIALIATLPVAAMLLFMFLPRADELLDRLWAATRSFDLNLNMQSKQPVPEATRERTNRAWFEQHNENMKRLDTLRKKSKGADRKIKGKTDKKGKVDMPAPSLPALKKDAELEKKAQDEARKAAKKPEKKEPEKKAEALKDKEKKEKEKKAKKEDKAKEEQKEKEDPKSPKDKKDKKQAEKPKDPKKEPEKALADADKKKEEAKNPKKDEKKDEKKGDPESSKAGKPESSAKQSMKERSANRRKAAAEADRIRKELLENGFKNGGAGKEGEGSGAGKKDGAGKDGGKKGGGSGGGASSEKKSLRPKRTTAADKIILGINDKELPLTITPDPPSDAVIMLVKSRRLVFLRRNCFDVYTGKAWTRSGDAKDQTNPAVVKVVDGLVEKEFIVPAAPQAVPQTPTAYPQQTYQQGYPQYSGDPNNRQVTKAPVNILAGSGTTIPSAASNLPVGAGVNQPATQPSKIESTASTSAPQQVDFRGHERVFQFISKERPKFLVNMADAFAIPPNFPSVDLVEEIQVKAKSIGRIVPAAWIPQEIGLAKENIQENLKVDELGVISLKKPLVLNNVFKVKTTLPMYPLNSMRTAAVKTPAEEEKIRDTFKSSLQLPLTIDDEVFTLAEQQADPRYNWFVQCEQLASFLRLNYKYDFDRQVAPGVEDCVKELLFVRKTGFSCDYASAFVVMARCLGIPARVVNGYSPGKLNKVTGNQEITPSDGAHWAEAYIPDYGWVPFDATPEGFLPAQKRENNYTFTEVKKQLGIDKEKQKEELEREAIKVLDWIVAILVALVLLTVSFFVGRALYNAIKRYIANRTGRGPEWGIYKKTCKQLKKRLKVKREPQETSAQFVERVRSTVAEQRAQGKSVSDGIPAALEAFMTTYNQVYFGKRVDELENLKYHADQLNKQIGTNTKSEAMAAAGGAASTQSEGAVRPPRR